MKVRTFSVMIVFLSLAPLARAVATPIQEALEAYYEHNEPLKALPTLSEACKNKAEYCLEVGDIYRLGGKGVQPDYPKAEAAYQIGCFRSAKAGSVQANCNILGFMYLKGQGIPQDFAKAKTAFTRACDLGGSGGCYYLGEMYYVGQGVKQDFGTGRTYFGKACDIEKKVHPNGDSPSCVKYNELQKNPEDAYKKPCDEGDAEACVKLGAAYMLGERVPRDWPRAAELFEKACDGGSATGCLFLGSSYYHGQGVGQDRSTALRYFTRACDLNLRDGCVNSERLKNGLPISGTGEERK